MPKSLIAALATSFVLSASAVFAQASIPPFFFTKGSTTLIADSNDRIPVVAATLKSGNKTKVVVTGHCTPDDLEEGATAALAMDRANIVADGLRAHGVTANISVTADQACTGSGAFDRFVDVTTP